MKTTILNLYLFLFLAAGASGQSLFIGASPPAASGGAGTGLKNNLSAVWAMEAASAADESDSTANAITLTHHGGTTQTSTHVEGSFSTSVGSSQYYDSANSLVTFGGATSFSMAMWIQPQSTDPTSRPFADQWNVGQKFSCETDGAAHAKFYMHGSTTVSVTSTVAMANFNWHLLCFGYDASLQQIWIQVDNETRVTASFTQTPASPAENFTIGCYAGGGGTATSAFIDFSAFWKGRSLSTSDVTLLVGTYNFGTQTGAPLFYANW